MKKIVVISLSALLMLGCVGSISALNEEGSETWGQMGNRYWDKAKPYTPGITTVGALGAGLMGARNIAGSFPLRERMEAGLKSVNSEISKLGTGVSGFLGEIMSVPFRYVYLKGLRQANGLVTSGLIFALISQAIASLGVGYEKWNMEQVPWLREQVKIAGPVAIVSFLATLIHMLPEGRYRSMLEGVRRGLIIALPVMPGLAAAAYHYTPYFQETDGDSVEEKK